MNKRTWIILGATSVIAEQFAHQVALLGHDLRLVGRNAQQMQIIAQDIELRFKVRCEVVAIDMSTPSEMLLSIVKPGEQELDLLIAQSDFTLNKDLTAESIIKLIQINIEASTLLIHAYLQLKQEQHNLVYISSMAAVRGRAKNSLYGASKRAMELYLQGLQQSAPASQNITIARLGFIDTRQMYGTTSIIPSASPIECAKACFSASRNRKNFIYFPKYCRLLTLIMLAIPNGIIRKLQKQAE